MTQKARNRGGRPKGSGGVDDRENLNAMADLICRRSDLSVTAAAGIVVKKLPEHKRSSAVRRLQYKWKQTGAERLDEARYRHAATRSQVRLSNLIDQETAHRLSQTVSGLQASFANSEVKEALQRIALTSAMASVQMRDSMVRSGLLEQIAGIQQAYSGLRINPELRQSIENAQAAIAGLSEYSRTLQLR